MNLFGFGEKNKSMKAEIEIKIIDSNCIEVLGKKYYSMDYINKRINTVYKESINIHVAKLEHVECPKCGHKNE